MKQQRRTAEDGKEHLLAVMREIHAQVTSQSEFTARRVAEAAGISKEWLYHIAGEEFRALRAGLPGSRKTRDEEVAALRWGCCGEKMLSCARSSKQRKNKHDSLPRRHSKRRWSCWNSGSKKTSNCGGTFEFSHGVWNKQEAMLISRRHLLQ
jgi:hypothetical protein